MDQSRNASALVIFTKAPIPGDVKTRLCPPLTPDEAASLHGSFVLDAVERCRHAAEQVKGALDRFAACAPSREHVFFKVMEGRFGLRCLDQVGTDLGSRMAHTFATLFGQGYTRVILVGTDVPTLPNGYYGQALAQLGDHDVVLGPSLDGGYHLIGLTQPLPELFSRIPWSTDQVFRLTQDKAATMGMRVGLLPPWRDVDTAKDLRALLADCRPLLQDQGRGKGKRGAPQGGRPAPSASGAPGSLSPTLSPRTAGALRLIASRLRERNY